MLWYLVAAEVGGSEEGWTGMLVDKVLVQNHWFLVLFLSLYKHAMAIYPAWVISFSCAPLLMNTSACCWNMPLVLILVSDNFFSSQYTPEVVSQTRIACKNRMLSEMVSPSISLKEKMFQHLVDDSACFFAWGLKNTLNLTSLEW